MNSATFLAFVEAFLTVFVTGLTGVMAQAGSVYTWPSGPATFLFALGGILAGVRHVQALNAAPPRP